MVTSFHETGGWFRQTAQSHLPVIAY